MFTRFKFLFIWYLYKFILILMFLLFSFNNYRFVNYSLPILNYKITIIFIKEIPHIHIKVNLLIYLVLEEII